MGASRAAVWVGVEPLPESPSPAARLRWAETKPPRREARILMWSTARRVRLPVSNLSLMECLGLERGGLRKGEGLKLET